MPFWKRFWADDAGLVLSAEAVLVGTVGILGATVGLTAVRNSVNDELTEMAFAIRSLDQSYCIPGRMSCCGAWTAGSQYIQPDVQQSLADLCAEIETMHRGGRFRSETDHSAAESPIATRAPAGPKRGCRCEAVNCKPPVRASVVPAGAASRAIIAGSPSLAP